MKIIGTLMSRPRDCEKSIIVAWNFISFLEEEIKRSGKTNSQNNSRSPLTPFHFLSHPLPISTLHFSRFSLLLQPPIQNVSAGTTTATRRSNSTPRRPILAPPLSPPPDRPSRRRRVSIPSLPLLQRFAGFHPLRCFTSWFSSLR